MNSKYHCFLIEFNNYLSNDGGYLNQNEKGLYQVPVFQDIPSPLISNLFGGSKIAFVIYLIFFIFGLLCMQIYNAPTLHYFSLLILYGLFNTYLLYDFFGEEENGQET